MDRSMLKHKDIFGAGMPTPFLHADGSTPFRFDQDSTPEKYYQNHPEETAAGFRFDVYSTPKKYDDTFGTGGNFASNVYNSLQDMMYGKKAQSATATETVNKTGDKDTKDAASHTLRNIGFALAGVIIVGAAIVIVARNKKK